MGSCPRCGNPMIQAASHPVPWCSVYGTHAIKLPRAPDRTFPGWARQLEQQPDGQWTGR